MKENVPVACQLLNIYCFFSNTPTQLYQREYLCESEVKSERPRTISFQDILLLHSGHSGLFKGDILL